MQTPRHRPSRSSSLFVFLSFVVVGLAVGLTACASSSTQGPPRSSAGARPGSAEDSESAASPAPEDAVADAGTPSLELIDSAARDGEDAPASEGQAGAQDEEAPPPPRPAAVQAVAHDAGPGAIRFRFDSARLDKASKAHLRVLADQIRADPSARVTVEGHCDERGTEEYNLALGLLRADAIKAYLVQRGVEEDRITTVTYGEERPSREGRSEAVFAENRRGELLLHGEGAATASVVTRPVVDDRAAR